MTGDRKIRVVVVDDHAMLRTGLAVFLKSYDDLLLVGEASNGAEAIALCAECRPDIVLMDLMMPIMDGITAIRLIHIDFPDIRLIALTSFGEERLIRDVLQAGAVGYLFKKISSDDLAEAIRSAYQGHAAYAPEVTNILVKSLRTPDAMFDNLTSREREVLGLLVKGLGNTEIAAQLVISKSTTKSHVSRILEKLGVASRTEAIVRVLEHNLNLGAFYIP